MAFNSLGFFLFLPVAFLAYFFAGERTRWMILLAASLVFYAALKVPYLLGVLAGVSFVTYAVGIRIHKATGARSRRRWLGVGIAANLAILVFLKYLPFAMSNLRALFEMLSLQSSVPVPRLLVSIGVSYFLFQAISYLIDIYLEIVEPERHLGRFALYMAFFPKLLQGPIERAGDLIPQFRIMKLCDISGFRTGVFMILLGLLKKCVLADRIALFVDPVFADIHRFSGLNLLFAVYAYAFQIYFDFSGYTDIALGCAKLFNVELTQNFNGPYLARSLAEFWRRWHISFSRWILDYIFKPLQMHWRNRRNVGTAAALLITFLLSGLWHGASWGFIAWGGLHGLYLAASIFYKPYQKRLHKRLGVEKAWFLKTWQIVITFHLVCLAWVFFRAASIRDAWYVLTHAFSGPFRISDLKLEVEILSESGSMVQELAVALGMGALVLLLSVVGRQRFLDHLAGKPIWFRAPVYYLGLMALLIFGLFTKHDFAYVRF